MTDDTQPKGKDASQLIKAFDAMGDMEGYNEREALPLTPDEIPESTASEVITEAGESAPDLALQVDKMIEPEGYSESTAQEVAVADEVAATEETVVEGDSEPDTLEEMAADITAEEEADEALAQKEQDLLDKEEMADEVAATEDVDKNVTNEALAQKDQELSDKEQMIATKEQELTSKDQELAEAKTRLSQAEAKLAEAESAQANLTEKEEELTSKDQELAEAKTSLTEAEANLAATETKLAAAEELAKEEPILLNNLEGKIPGALQQVVAHSKQSFLAFDKDCKVVPIYSGSHPLFGEVSGEEDAMDLLFHKLKPSNRDAASFNNTEADIPLVKELMATVFMRITDLEVIVEMLPTELQDETRYLELDYQYLKAAKGDDDCILVRFTNMSFEKELKAEIEREKVHSNMIIKVAVDIEGYVSFYNASQDALGVMLMELDQEAADVNISGLLNSMDLLCSGAELYEMGKLNETARRIEDKLEALHQSTEPLAEMDQDELLQRVDGIKDQFSQIHNHYLKTLVDHQTQGESALVMVETGRIDDIKIGITKEIKGLFTTLETMFEKNYTPFTKLPQLAEITTHRLAKIKTFLWEQVYQRAEDTIGAQLHELQKQKLTQTFKRYNLIAESLSNRLHKQLVIEISGADIDVPLDRLHNLFSSVTHLIRNSVEHGIESMEERVAQGKDLDGHLAISAEISGSDLILKVTDDGRGINTEKLKSSLVAKGVYSAEEVERLGEQEILLSLFKSEFSSKENLAGVSHGVGLETVQTQTEAVNGTITVTSKQNEGTSFIIQVPL
ncbi:MAG: ATP-binding protein [SAR324 cluster bacterium]|nr:ATP-binding protein [SAR324 cluster bacterium]